MEASSVFGDVACPSRDEMMLLLGTDGAWLAAAGSSFRYLDMVVSCTTIKLPGNCLIEQSTKHRKRRVLVYT